MPLQIRRGTEAERLALTPSTGLVIGELLYNTTDKRLYIGTGDAGQHQGISVTGFTTEDAQDAVWASLNHGGHAGITFSYDDVGNIITASVNLSDYNGTLKASAFSGTLVADDSTILVDAVNGSFNLVNTVNTNIIPRVNEAYDIGSSAYRFKDLYLKGTSIFLGNATITNPSGSIVNLPAGSTIGGVEIGTAVSTDTAWIRDLQGSVFADDSTIMVDSVSNILSNGNVSIEQQFIQSTGGNPLSLYGGASQTQVIFPTIAAGTTGGAITTAGGTWKTVDILAYKGDVRSPAGDMASGDVLGVLKIAGYNSSTAYDQGALIGAQVDPIGTVANNHTPTKLFFANQGLTFGDPAVLMTFDSAGQLAIGQENAQATLDVNGVAKLAVLTADPYLGTPPDGVFAIADGTSWDPTSSTKQTLVVSLGGVWVQVVTEP